MPRTRRARGGATAVEFALILPTFILLIFGVMDFGWLFFQRATLDMASTVGCRAGALIDPGVYDSHLADVQAAAEAAMEDEMVRAGAGACEDDCYTDVMVFGNPPGRSLVCVVGREAQPLVGLFLGPVVLESSIAVRMEWQRWPLN